MKQACMVMEDGCNLSVLSMPIGCIIGVTGRKDGTLHEYLWSLTDEQTITMFGEAVKVAEQREQDKGEILFV